MHLVCKFKASKVYIQYTYICVLRINGSLTIINSVDCFLGRLTIIFCEVVAFRKAFCVCMSRVRHDDSDTMINRTSVLEK